MDITIKWTDTLGPSLHRTLKELFTLITLITSRLDDCKCHNDDWSRPMYKEAQTVQKAAARLLTGQKRSCTGLLTLASCLFQDPVQNFITCFYASQKLGTTLLMWTVKASYPSESTTNQLLLDVSRSRLKYRGDGALSVAPPSDLRTA